MRLLLTGVIAGALMVPGAIAGVKGRQHSDAARIRQGVESGQLTRVEARRLTAALKNLNQTVRRDRIDGGGLTPAERALIKQRQKKLSHQIYNEKHDGQTRP